jgi:large subunit ribosomal protein LP0
MVLNTGLIFTNGDLTEVKTILDSQVREAPARIGALAPSDVTIPAGPTGLDPKQTSFFQALNIQTKIVKSQVEIVNEVKVIGQDEKISAGQAALLDKLKIRPFEYKMHIKCFLDGGKIYDAKVLAISPDIVLSIFNAAAQNVTALSLGSGYIVSSAVPHLVLNAFKNLAAASFSSGYSFPQAEALKASAGSRPAAAGGATAAAAAPVKEEEPEPEEDVDMGDLFGGDY